MIDIPTIILEDIKDSDMLEDKLSEMALVLVTNIQEQLYPGHGYITGNLYGSIQSDYVSDGINGVVRAYPQGIEYAQWVDQGHHSWGGYHFMEQGLEETVAMYK